MGRSLDVAEVWLSETWPVAMVFPEPSGGTPQGKRPIGAKACETCSRLSPGTQRGPSVESRGVWNLRA